MGRTLSIRALGNADVGAARADLVDAEVGRALHVTRPQRGLRLLDELDREAEERLRLRDQGRGDVAPNLAARRRAVPARLVDGADDDVGRDVAREAEELSGTLARPSPVRVDHLALQVDREERDERAGDLERVRIEQSVGAEQPGRLARRTELLAEELSLRGQLPRDVNHLRVGRDAGDE